MIVVLVKATAIVVVVWLFLAACLGVYLERRSNR